jgi:uncharacterized protein (TIGR00299 family) protein
MKALYFDCFSGVSGDMILGSLLDLGLSLEALSSQLSKLSVKNYTLNARRVVKSHIAATKFEVQADPEHVHRNYFDIERIIRESDLSPKLREQSAKIFYRLAEAEAKVHASTIDQIHFHEVGAIDAIVDIVGACIGFAILGIEEIHASALNVGTGSVESAHGTLPVPAPATAELLKGIPIYSNQLAGELVTPTGAAILSTLCQGFGKIPLFQVQKIGYGAGSRDFPQAANVLRTLQGESFNDWEASIVPKTEPSVIVIEANIDDMNPQIYGHLLEKLFGLGALDVFACPVQMKKNRPGMLLSVVIPKQLIEAVSDTLFRETTTIGFRYYEAQRKTLDRQLEEIESEFGIVRVKVSRLNGKIVNFSPEYEECRSLALKHNVPYKWIQSRIIQQFMNLHSKEI